MKCMSLETYNESNSGPQELTVTRIGQPQSRPGPATYRGVLDVKDEERVETVLLLGSYPDRETSCRGIGHAGV